MQESTGRIPKDSQTGRLGKSLDEQLRLSGGYVGTCIEGYTSDVPAGMWETLDETLAYRISCIRKDNRDRCRSIFSRLGGRRSSCDDYIDLETDQFCSRILEPLNISNSKPAFNEDVLSLNPTEIPQLLKEGVISGYGRSKSEITYLSRLQRLLRARRERPRGCRAAEQRNEIAPLHFAPLSPRITAYHIVVRNAALCITAKLRADVADGSFASPRHARGARGMSAMPPIATELVLRNERSRCAISRHSQCSRQLFYSITLSAHAIRRTDVMECRA